MRCGKTSSTEEAKARINYDFLLLCHIRPKYRLPSHASLVTHFKCVTGHIINFWSLAGCAGGGAPLAITGIPGASWRWPPLYIRGCCCCSHSSICSGGHAGVPSIWDPIRYIWLSSASNCGAVNGL